MPHWLGLRAGAALIAAAVLIWGACGMAADGLTTIKSNYGPKETIERLEGEIKSKGLTVFARIDHAAGATQAGLPLRPTYLFIFGNAKGGTPLMQADQEVGIDLPLKILVWQDQADQTWLSYNDPHWIAKRHGLSGDKDAVINALTNAVRSIAGAAGGAQQ